MDTTPAASQCRVRDAVIFKTLGATRARILSAHFIEYGVLALTTGVIAAALGTCGAWLVVTFGMEATFIFSASAILTAITLAIALVLLFGALATWRVLGAKTVQYLRQP